MKANRAYRLIVHRESHEPAIFADPGRRDRVEVIDIDDGEVVLLWDLPPREASHVLRLLRADLASMAAEDFIDKWRGADDLDD